jgi:hypothetical protein
VRQSFASEYLKTLDSDFYFSLRSPLAKRLYRLIDRKRQGNPRWSTSLDKLKDMAPLAPSYKTPSKIRDVLETAHGELQRRGYLAGVSYEKRNGSNWVRWRVEPEFDRRRSLNSQAGGLSFDSEPTEDERRAVSHLAEKGVWTNVARDLVRRHGPEACLLQAESLRFQKGVTDPPAWLRWAIETDHHIPNQLRPQPSLMDVEETEDGPPPPRKPRAPEDPRGDEPEPAVGDGPNLLAEDVRRRLETGEFDAAIEAFEGATAEQYARHVATSVPVQADDTGNRYYVSLDGNLYLCLDRSTAPEHLVHVRSLDRSEV